MRNLFLLVSLLALATIGVSQTWETFGLDGIGVSKVMPDNYSPDSVFGVAMSFSDPPFGFLVRTTDRGASWDSLGEYNGATLHPATAETIFAAFGVGSYSDGIYRSNDYGRSFGSTPPVWGYMVKDVVYDKREPNFIFGWSSDVYVSNDGGATWETMTISPAGGSFNGMCVDPTANNRVYAWDNFGSVFLSSDHGRIWERISYFDWAWIPNEVAVSPLDTNVLYAACEGGFAKSRDCGTTWELTEIHDAPALALYTFDDTYGKILLGGYFGILISTDDGVSWENYHDELDYIVYDIEFGPASSGGRVTYAATSHGIMLSREGPSIKKIIPSDGDCGGHSPDYVFIGISDVDGLDPASLALSCNGVEYTADSAEITLADTAILFYGDFSLDGLYLMSLISLTDALGNPIYGLPYNWEFTIDWKPPEMDFRYPDSAEVVPLGDITIKLHLIDEGCGLSSAEDSMSSYFWVEGTELYVWMSPCVLFEADTFFVNLPCAGISVSIGDTINVRVRYPDVGWNYLDVSWEFYIAPTGISDAVLPKSPRILVFPNPFNSSARIDIEGDFADNEEINIYDISGHKVDVIKLEKNNNAYLWQPDENISSGIYFAALSSRAMPPLRLILLR